MNAPTTAHPPPVPFRVHEAMGNSPDDGALWPQTRVAIERLGYRLTNAPGKLTPKLGDGGYGAAFHAKRVEGDRSVVIKVFHDASSAVVASFQNERKTLESPDFPRDVAPVCLDARHDDGAQPFLVLEFVRGTEIDKFVNKMRRDARVELLEKLADGAHRLNHDGNLLHRDISAANTLVSDKGDVRLIDLGLAGGVIRRDANTIDARGNPIYSPPEVQRGDKRADVKDEVYNCAMVALHVLTDLVPPENTVRSGDPEHLQRCRNRLAEGKIKGRLAKIVLHGLREESQRYTTPGAFRDALHDWRVLRPQRIRRNLGVLALTTLLCAFAAVGWMLYLDKQQSDELREYAELLRQSQHLAYATHDAVKPLLERAQDRDQTWRDQQRRRDPTAPATLAEATRLLRRAIAVSVGLEKAQPRREALGLFLNSERFPWAKSPALAKRKKELRERYTHIGTDLAGGRIEEAPAALDALQIDLAKLLAENEDARQTDEALANYELLAKGVAERLRKLDGFSPQSQVAAEARAAWQDGQWSNATKLFGVARDQLASLLKKQETPEESRLREQGNEEIVRRIEQEKAALQSQVAGLAAERDTHLGRVRDLETKITKVTTQGAEDREQLKLEKARADEFAGKNSAGSATLADLRKDKERIAAEKTAAESQAANLAKEAARIPKLVEELKETKNSLASAQRELGVWKTAPAKTSDSAAAALAALLAFQTEIDALDPKDWRKADETFRDAGRRYQLVVAEKEQAAKRYQPSSGAMSAIEARRVVTRQALDDALAKRDQADSVEFQRLQTLVDRGERDYVALTKELLPTEQQPRTLRSKIEGLKRQQKQHEPGRLRLAGNGPKVDPVELLGKLPLDLLLGGETYTSPSSGMELRRVAPGEFERGAKDNEPDSSSNEKPRHRARITYTFYPGTYPVKQHEYTTVMGTNPSYFSKTGGGKDKVQGLDTSRFPVENVSWFDGIAFLNKLSELDRIEPFYGVKNGVVTILGGDGYRYLFEVEYEYIARADTTTIFPWGDSLSADQANFNGNYPYGNAKKGKYLEQPRPVDSYPKNRWGFFDTVGNVWQWVYDGYDENYYQQFAGKVSVDSIGPSTASLRVNRGGGWLNFGQDCRPANRGRGDPGYRYFYLGFRASRGWSNQPSGAK